MLKAKNLQIVFHFNDINIEENTEKIIIAEVLENKFTLQVALALRKLNITLINSSLIEQTTK